MTKILQKIKYFTKDQSGAPAIEYGLIAGLIAVAIITALFGTGQSLGEIYNETIQLVTNAING
ncbi:MAG: Flp family type IVb pilin [Hyphomicrobiales bacterium]